MTIKINQSNQTIDVHAVTATAGNRLSILLNYSSIADLVELFSSVTTLMASDSSSATTYKSTSGEFATIISLNRINNSNRFIIGLYGLEAVSNG